MHKLKLIILFKRDVQIYTNVCTNFYLVAVKV